MIFLTILIFLFLVFITSASKKECYENFLNFGDKPCFDKTTKSIPYNEIFNGKMCQEIACMSRLNTLKASVCIQLKKNEFRFILIGDERNSSHDIPTTIEDNDPFTIKQIAVSDTHFSLLLISHEAAYRMQFFIEELNEVNRFKLEYLGSANSIAWHPLADSDVFMEMNGTGIKNTRQLPHRKINVHHFISKAVANGNSYKPCLKWTDIRLLLPSTTTSTIATKMLPEILPQSLPKIPEAGITLGHLIIVGLIIVSLAVLVVIYKAMKWENHNSDNHANPVGYISQTQAIGLVCDPREDEAETSTAAVVQPPPSYHTQDIANRIEQIESRLNNIQRSISQQNQTANSRSHVPDILEPLMSQTGDPFIDSKM